MTVMDGVVVVAWFLVIAALCIGAVVVLLSADTDRYIDEPEDTDPDLLPRRMDEWQTSVDRIKQNRGNQ